MWRILSGTLMTWPMPFHIGARSPLYRRQISSPCISRISGIKIERVRSKLRRTSKEMDHNDTVLCTPGKNKQKTNGCWFPYFDTRAQFWQVVGVYFGFQTKIKKTCFIVFWHTDLKTIWTVTTSEPQIDVKLVITTWIRLGQCEIGNPLFIQSQVPPDGYVVLSLQKGKIQNK